MLEDGGWTKMKDRLDNASWLDITFPCETSCDAEGRRPTAERERENVENKQTHAQEWCCNSALANHRYNNIKSNPYKQLCNRHSNMIRRCTLL